MRTKVEYACKLAAALGYIALRNTDRLGVYSFGDRLETALDLCHGKGKIFPMLRALSGVECGGEDTQFDECLRGFQARTRRKGIVVILSDFFAPAGYTGGLDLLRWAKHDLFCVQVLDGDEMKCNWKGDIELECVETRRRKRVTIGPAEAARYAAAMQKWNDTLRQECARREIGFARTTIAEPFEDVIQRILRRGGLVA